MSKLEPHHKFIVSCIHEGLSFVAIAQRLAELKTHTSPQYIAQWLTRRNLRVSKNFEKFVGKISDPINVQPQVTIPSLQKREPKESPNIDLTFLDVLIAQVEREVGTDLDT